MSEARGKVIKWIQKKRPEWNRKHCEANADKIIADIKAEARCGLPEPIIESEVKRKIKKQAGIK